MSATELAAPAAAPEEPLVTITVPLSSAHLIRTHLAHGAAGVRPWASNPDEAEARRILAEIEGAQRNVEAAIRAVASLPRPDQPEA